MKYEVYFLVIVTTPKPPLTTTDFGECDCWNGEDLCLDNVIDTFLVLLTLA